MMDLKTRVVEICGVSVDPDGAYMQQIGRNLLDAVDGFLLDKTHLILDRDPLYTRAFRTLLGNAGVKVKRLPPHIRT